MSQIHSLLAEDFHCKSLKKKDQIYPGLRGEEHTFENCQHYFIHFRFLPYPSERIHEKSPYTLTLCAFFDLKLIAEQVEKKQTEISSLEHSCENRVGFSAHQ